jgi:hypothetical protein
MMLFGNGVRVAVDEGSHAGLLNAPQVESGS